MYSTLQKFRYLYFQHKVNMNQKYLSKSYNEYDTTSVFNYKTILRIFFVAFYKTPLLFSTTLIISLHTCLIDIFLQSGINNTLKI